MKEDGWSKSIIAVARRWQHQTYQHQSTSVTAAASQRGMRACIWRTPVIFWVYFWGALHKEASDVATEPWCLQLRVLLTFFFSCITLRMFPFLPLHVSAAIIHNRNVHLRGDASERIFSGHYRHARLHLKDHFTEDWENSNTLLQSVIFVQSAFFQAEMESDVNTWFLYIREYSIN